MTSEAFVKKGRQELERYNLDEIARLRAEVERLRGDLRVSNRVYEAASKFIAAIETALDGELPTHYTEDNATAVGAAFRLMRERDEAFKEVERLKSKYEPIARA